MHRYLQNRQVDIMERVNNLKRLSDKEKRWVAEAFENLTPAIEIANTLRISRQAVYKILRKAGVDTAKSGGIEVSCSACQKTVKKHKCKVRKAKHIFCDMECYTAFLSAGNGLGPHLANRHGQRIARGVVGKLFNLDPGHIVHHINRNTLDNQPSNLIVFRNQGDHIRHHRGFEVEPLWDGSKT